MNNSPQIKAVEMTRSIREAHHAQLEGKTPEEVMAFFREKALALHASLGLPQETSNESSTPSPRERIRR